ncbi:flagellar assembly protein FliW [Sulfurospirillum sp. 1612]|uniref:flagellar assembly protein FliW n=1 Tax=Sulfurospirillum sp. 1612 TaxID=3094835 RepID=UPI002F94C423
MTFDIISPILGFEGLKTVNLEKIDDFFMKLKSPDNTTEFTLINPFMLRSYDFEVPAYFKKLLELDENTNISIFNIMITTSPIEDSTVNFIAPLIFNHDRKIMAQVLLDASKHQDFGIIESISSYI